MASMEPQHKLFYSSKAISASENCNPNVIPGSCKRKITKSSTADQFLESNSAAKNLTSQATSAEFNLISPPRKHVCSSRRSASNNPDYAVPATVHPKKFLAAKTQILSPQGATLCKCGLPRSKKEDGTADGENGSMEACNRCFHDSQNRRRTSNDSISRNLAGDGVPTSSEHNTSKYPDSEQIEHSEQGSVYEDANLPASETAHQECLNNTPKFWRSPNDSPNLETVSDVNHSEDSTSQTTWASPNGERCGSESKHRAANSFAYCFGTSCLDSAPEESGSGAGDDPNASLTPENEEAAVSPSPEKSGNWRLNAVLEAFGNLSPTREGRVKTLVRAFESLLSVTERKGQHQARKPRYPLKFSYLCSNENLDGEENDQREDFTDGAAGESEREEASNEEERVGQWQNNVSEVAVNDEEVDGQWQSPHAMQRYSQSIVDGKEKDGLGEQWLQEQEYVESREEVEELEEQWLQEQECVESREEVESDEREYTTEKVLQKQQEQEDNGQLAVDAEDKGVIDEQWQLPVVMRDEKLWQSHEEERDARSFQKSHEEMDEMKKALAQKHEDQGILAPSAVEEDGEKDDRKKKTNEEQAEAATLEKGGKTNKQQPSDLMSTQSLIKKVLIEGEPNKDSDSQELETRHVPAFSVNPTETAFDRQPSTQKIRTNLQQQSSQKSTDGQFAFKAARKQQSCRIRESVRASSCSISSTRPPLTQKSQMQSAQDKPRLSKPQPFRLLTEARGHMKEQEFVMKLKTLLEEEEKLRVPLAQGLPWTTDEPEIPYKPPAKENTKPLDIHLNSDLRAMERAEFDHFIAEKLLYIEQRRMEEECLRRAAEEEEIKKMRQEMVPKAQLMPYFDRPFRPRRSSKRPTIPKEPQFKMNKQQPKRQKCAVNST